MLAVVTCQCGSTESLVRNFLKRAGYSDWYNIPIHQGKEKSRKIVEYLPRGDGRDTLDSYLRNASKWAIIVGYNDTDCRWSDIAHNRERSTVEASFLVEMFA